MRFIFSFIVGLWIGLIGVAMFFLLVSMTTPYRNPEILGVTGSSKDPSMTVMPKVTHLNPNEIDTIEHAVVWLGTKKVGTSLLRNSDKDADFFILVPLRPWAAAFGDVNVTYVKEAHFEGEPENTYFVGWKRVEDVYIYRGIAYAPLVDLMAQAGLKSVKTEGSDVYVERYE